MNVIETDSLSKAYKVHKRRGGCKGAVKDLFAREEKIVEAVKGISFQIQQGEVVGFIGANGAGKTTTLKMLTGLLYPTAGRAEVMGYTPWERKHEYLRRIGFLMGQKGQLLWDIPAYDSMLLNKEIYHLSETHFTRAVKELSQILEVEHLLKVPVRTLSLGQRMKMEIMASILHGPEILFLDEPTIGLDITTQKSMRKFLEELNRKNQTTMMVTSHYMADITALCDRIIMISQGEVLFDGKIEKLRQFSGDQKRIRICFEKMPENEKLEESTMLLDKGELPKIGFLQKYSESLKEHSGLQYIFQIRQDQVSDFLQEIVLLHPRDISIEDPPIEDIIEKIYMGGDLS